MTSKKKTAIDSLQVGLSMMIFFTALWTVIAEIVFEGLDHFMVAVFFGLILLIFIYKYWQLSRVKAHLRAMPEEISKPDDKKKGKWFWIIFVAEGFLILLIKNILLNTGYDHLFLPCFALIVGLHFFPLGWVFNRKFDYYIGAWTSIIPIAGLVFLTKGNSDPRIVNGLVALGCAIATSCYGFKMIYESSQIL
jgi:hypothetical protein